MPIIATPNTIPQVTCCPPTAPVNISPNPVSCVGQHVITPSQAYARGKPVLRRMRAVTVKGGQKATIQWEMRDRDGNPVDLRECLCQGSSDSVSASEECPTNLKFRMREYLSVGVSATTRAPLYEFPVVEVDLTRGLLQVEIPPTATRQPGVFFGEFAVVGTDDDGAEYVVFSNMLYVYIERGNWSHLHSRRAGLPSIAEVRLHLRDSGPEESYLLDNIRFDDAEISLAATMAIDYWNEIPPPVARYTTQNFPFRYHWLMAIAGNLFLMVAEQFRANNLKYSAGGVSVDDQDKEPNYEQAAQRRLTEWREFVKRKKAEINLNLGWAALGSPYDRYGWRPTGGATVR